MSTETVPTPASPVSRAIPHATPKKLTVLPKQLYVTLEADTRDPHTLSLVAAETLDAVGDGEVIGIYELQATHTVRVTRALE